MHFLSVVTSLSPSPSLQHRICAVTALSSLSSPGPGCRPAGSSSFPPIATEMAAALSALRGPLGLRSPPGSAFFGTAHARSVLERINFLPLLIAGLSPAPSFLRSLAASAKLVRTEVRDGAQTGGLWSGRRRVTSKARAAPALFLLLLDLRASVVCCS